MVVNWVNTPNAWGVKRRVSTGPSSKGSSCANAPPASSVSASVASVGPGRFVKPRTSRQPSRTHGRGRFCGRSGKTGG